ncbi:terminase [Galactobacillus timonensis]|uniref:terminase n=1 Tax=Galactobacillus timonensis TaxID=2041840 RepID=UPI000C845E26|nr:terminase [Galactobacillus timonensis]
MAAPKRLGRQTPTASVVLPYTQTHGQEAVDLYEKTGRKAMDWQRLLIYDMLAYNSEDLWVHTKFGYAVPRRNGKNEVVVMRELYGLMNGETILHTAHRTPTSSSAFQRLYDALTACGYKEKEDFDSYRQYGLERIEMIGTKGKCSFRTRTSKGGLGEGFDLLVIDEAQEYQDDQETTLKYVISSSHNPQTLLCGTPPTPVSSGTVFMNLRKAIFSGDKKDACWEEWSVDHLTDVHDVDAWYETNPSLGTILTERIIADEIGTNELDFNIQRLGYWTTQNLRSAISENQWNELKVDTLPKFRGKLYAGIRFSADGKNVSLSIAVKTYSDAIFVEGIDCQPQRNGLGWIIRFLKKADLENVVIDGQSGQQMLMDAMKDAGIKKPPIIPKVSEVIEANALFQQNLDQKLICHRGQPSLTQSVTNVQRRAIGSNGGFGYKSIKENVDVSLMESMIFAFWSCRKTKERRKQRVFY